MKIFIVVLLLLLCSVVTRAQTCTDGQSPQWSSSVGWTCVTVSPGGLPAGTGVTMIVANAGATGTTLNKFAKLTGAPSTAVIASNGDTENAIGIVTAGAGTTGNATITILGQVSCVFSGATTAGNYVTIAATGGGCQDAGSAFPTSAAAYGRVLSTNGGAGTYVMELMTPDIAFQNAGNGKSKPGGSTGDFQFNNAGVFAGGSISTSGTIVSFPSSSWSLRFGGAGQGSISNDGTDLNINTFGLELPSSSRGLIASQVYLGQNAGVTGGVEVGTGNAYAFASTTDPISGSTDAALRRIAAGMVEVDNGTNSALGSETDLRDLLSRHYYTGRTGTIGNCLDSAGAAACGAATAGSVVIDAGATTVVVSTTQVTANSQIFVQYDSSLGTRLSVTCNTTPALPAVTARTAATSFTITVPAGPITNPACYSFFIVN